MNLIQIIIIIVIFLGSIFFIQKYKKQIKETGEYSFIIIIIIWLLLLIAIIINSGIFNTKLPEELGGGARYIPKMEQKIKKQNTPKFKNADRDYKREGKEALDKSLK